jgi:lysophospholipase L1-like esterase
MAPVLWIGGSSHALAFSKAFKKIKNLQYDLKYFAKSGATFETILSIFPNINTFKEGDVLILFVFGNDMFKKGSHQIQVVGGHKVIHLKHFWPQTEDHMRDICIKLDTLLAGSPVKVVIVTNFYRHLYCCDAHKAKYPDLLKHQKKCNLLITNFFQKKANRTLVDHRHLLLGAQQYNLKGYREKQPDSVHFGPKDYENMANKLLKKVSE